MASYRKIELNTTVSSQASRRDQSPSPSESVSNMSDDEEEYDQKDDQSRQDLEREDDSSREVDRRVRMGHPGSDNRDQTESMARISSEYELAEDRLSRDDSSLSRRSRTQSFDDSESLNGENSEAEGTSKSQALTEEVEHLVVEHVWSNDAIWKPPPPETDDDEVGTNLVDEDDDDDEGGWGQQSSSGSVRSSSDYAQSKANLRAVVDGHFRALVAQLLQEHNLPVGEEGDPNSWLQVVSTLALQSANLVKPNTSKGGGMDPRGYVKVKCIASGRCADSVVVKGVVCHKNVQNRRMTSRFKNPRLLLLGGALEYQRSANQLSSLETLLQQELEYLDTTVARIEAHHPNVLLVEKTVAGHAQEALLTKEISLVLKVKKQLLDRIARCTGAHVLTSVDNLMAAKAGQCELFHIEKFDEDLNAVGPGSKKTSKCLMFFEGCPRPLGCTILLRGASTQELKTVKKVVQFAVFAAYHLALETSFLADEGATLPCLPFPSATSSLRQSTSDSCIPTVSGFTIPIASRSGIGYHGRSDSSSNMAVQGNNSSQGENLGSGIPQRDSSESLDLQPQSTADEFPPSLPNQQSILVLLSSRILRKGTVCERPRLKRINYYGAFDQPLGKFLTDFLVNTSNRCGLCEEPMEAHEHRYTHPQGSLTISSKLLKGSALAGERDGKIWMWHRCLRCPRVDGIPPPTRRVPISDSALDLSFGKFLSLSFSHHAAASRITSCGHLVHRDCLRFFGLGNVVACFHYSPIKIHTVHVPPPQLEFNHPGEQEWLRNEVVEIAELGDVVFAEAAETLPRLEGHIASLGSAYTSKVPEARCQVAELEGLLENERGKFEAQMKEGAPAKRLPSQPVADILALNKLRRDLASISGVWDSRVQILVAFLRSQNTGKAVGSKLNDSFTSTASPGSRDDDSSRTEGDRGGATNVEVPAVESGAAGLDVAEIKLEQLSIEDPSIIVPDESVSGAAEDDTTLAPERSLEQDALGLIVAGDERKDDTPVVVEESEEPRERLLVNALALDKQVSSPLPFSSQDQSREISPETKKMKRQDSASSAASSGVGEVCAPRSLSEGHFPILVDLPDTLEAAWRGDGGSIDATAVRSTPQGAAETLGGINAAVGGEVGVSDLAPMNTATSEREVDEGDEVAGAVGEVNAQVSVPTSLVKDKEGSDESGTPSGGSFASFYKGYSRSSSTQSSLSSASFQYNRSMSSSASTIGQLVAQATARVRLPLGVNDTVVAVYDDEPTSIIAYALTSREYQAQLEESARENAKERGDDGENASGVVEGMSAADSGDERLRTPPLDLSLAPRARREALIDESLVSTTPITVKVRFTDTSQQGKSEFRVICYYAKQFVALRAKCCGGESEYIRSLSRCKKFGAQGGKSNVFFAKTMDDRFMVKQVTSTEKYSFLDFAPQYFSHLCESLNSGSPTCLAKIFGLYTVTVKQAKGTKEKELDLVVMENLLYGRHTTRLYDLKGSKRSRYNADASGINKVLLDQNLLEAMPTAPIFVSNKAKLLLERAVYNDTSFLAKVNVMDYSLLVGVDEERQELVVGIIDFIRQYTWDKHLETWVKASGILGGPKNAPPTVISPKEYKKRFRKAMSNYFLVVPDFDTPPPLMSIANPPSESLLPTSDESQQAAGGL